MTDPQSDESAFATPAFDLELLRDPDTDPAAHQLEWKRLFEHFSPRLDSFFRSRVPENSDREDLISSVWQRTLENLHRLDSAAVFWNWLRKVGENRLIDLHRSRAAENRQLDQVGLDSKNRDESSIDDILSRLASDPYAGTGIGPTELRSRYLSLSSSDRALVGLILLDLPHREIAARLGLASEQASRQRWRRIRARLRNPA